HSATDAAYFNSFRFRPRSPQPYQEQEQDEGYGSEAHADPDELQTERPVFHRTHIGQDADQPQQTESKARNRWEKEKNRQHHQKHPDDQDWR
ncbi:MAG: hypothetical protein GY917_31600, partial [Planctomycetaceae bacterium]|nr:hypothetical protein [Planctomycetaceae bacterium]